MKKFVYFLFAILLLLIIIFAGRNIYKTVSENIEKTLYPLPEEYLTSIKQYSSQYNVPIETICAIINTESSFNPNAKSTANAMGIMQLTEETFLWLQFKAKEERKLDELYDYDTNIKYGTYLLSLLYEEFQDWDTVFAAYNAGRGRVNSWLSDSDYSKNGKLINIPFEETKKYITKVNKAEQKYLNLYFLDKSE